MTHFDWQQTPIYLASRSPRRRELLAQIGVSYELLDIEIDETRRASESPAEMVERLAESKSVAGWNATRRTQAYPVLGADTCVVIDNTVLGKPCDKAHGLAMLAKLSGREHQVLSAVSLCFLAQCVTVCSESRVTFRELSDKEIEAYWQTGEPCDKAGAYGIQGIGGAFITHLAGSYSGVMGLPLYETTRLIQRVEIHPR